MLQHSKQIAARLWLLFIFLSVANAQSGAPSDVIIDSTSSSERYSRSAYLAGKAAAEADLRQGKLAVETFGLIARPEAYARILNEKYHVELRRIAGCVIDAKILGHAKGYNEISEAEIKRRYGNDVFEKARAEAQKQ